MRGQILIIDDNPVDVKIVTSTMENIGFACHGFTAHEEAVSWLESNTPQLIFLDLQMPAITGYDLIPILKKISTIANVPMIIISGKNLSEDIMKAIKLGANDYIVKPLDPMILQEKVEKVNSKAASEFYTVDVASNGGIEACISRPIKILAFSEFGLKISSDKKISPGEVLELIGLPPEQFGKDRLLVRCLSCAEVGSQRFVAQTTFVGMVESQRQIIRLSCRKMCLQTKRVSA